MPKLFNFSGGGRDSSAAANATSTRMQAEIAANQMKASGYQHAASLFVSGVQAAQERAQRERLEKAQREMQQKLHEQELSQRETLQRDGWQRESDEAILDREFKRQQSANDIEFGQQGALVELMRGLGQSAIGAGVPPGAVMKSLMGAGAQTLGVPGAFGGSPGTMPGVPGGFPQEQDGSYSRMMQEGRAFDEWIVPEPEKSEGDKQRIDKDQVAQIRREVKGFILNPKTRKDVMIPIEVTPAQIFQLEGLMPKNLEEEVKRLWSWTAPIMVQGDLMKPATEDRSVLDEQLKWIEKKQPVEEIVSGQSMGAMREQLSGKYDQRNVDAALQSLYEEYGGFADTQEQAQAMGAERAREKIEKRNREAMPPSMQIQGGRQELLGQTLEREQEGELVGAITGGTPGPVPITKDALGGIGINVGSLGRYTQAAMNMPGYYWLELDPASGQVTVGARPGLVISPVLIKEINETFNDPKKKEPYAAIRAGSKLGQTMKRTSSEMKDATTLEGMMGAQGAAPKAEAPSGSHGDNSLSNWMKRSQAARPKPNRAPAIIRTSERLKSLLGGAKQ